MLQANSHLLSSHVSRGRGVSPKRPKGTKPELEVRRRGAVALLQAGWRGRQVARHVHASPSAGSRWRDLAHQHGDAGLRAKRHPGGTPRLTAAQQRQRLARLCKGARAHGLRTELWTLSRIATVIERHFGVRYCPSGVWHLLRRLRWSLQKPAHQARERDEAAIAHWRPHTWPRRKKKPGGRAVCSSSQIRPASCCNRPCGAPGPRGGTPPPALLAAP